jgi:hypothetical protein
LQVHLSKIDRVNETKSMPPRGTVLVAVSPKVKRGNSQRKMIPAKRSIAKEDSGIIDFGFIADQDNNSFRFSARKMQQDIKYIQEEVVWDMLIEPMFVDQRPKSRRLGSGRN